MEYEQMLKPQWISGHAIVPEWPVTGGAQRVVCADQAERALDKKASEMARLKAHVREAVRQAEEGDDAGLRALASLVGPE